MRTDSEGAAVRPEWGVLYSTRASCLSATVHSLRTLLEVATAPVLATAMGAMAAVDSEQAAVLVVVADQTAERAAYLWPADKAVDLVEAEVVAAVRVQILWVVLAAEAVSEAVVEPAEHRPGHIITVP